MTQSPLFALAFWIVLLPALWASGSLVSYRLRGGTPLFSGFLKLGLGLGVFASFLTFAGTFGWLKPEAVLCFLGVALMCGWRKGMGVFKWLNDLWHFLWESEDFFSRICQISLIGTIIFTAIFCFLPEISNDALAIQLYCAKIFAKKTSISPSFYAIDSYRPLLMSVLYSTGLLFQNVAISKLFHWFCGVLLVGALAVRVEESTGNKRLALFSCLMLWLTPTLMNQITTTYIDAGVSLFIFLGYAVLADNFGNPKPTNFFFGGVLIGLAVAIRPLSLGAAFPVLTMISLGLFRNDVRRQLIFCGFLFALGVLLTSLYWFLRDWIYTGNPVYPLLGSLFGTEDYAQLSSIYFHGMGLPRSLGSFLCIPLDITFKPQYFDYHHWVGPIYLCALPLFLYAAVKIKEARSHFKFVLFFTVFWYFTGQNVRYLLPAL